MKTILLILMAANSAMAATPYWQPPLASTSTGKATGIVSGDMKFYTSTQAVVASPSVWVDGANTRVTVRSGASVTTMTATGFAGPLTGNVVGNVTGTLSGNVQSATTVKFGSAVTLQSSGASSLQVVDGVSYDALMGIKLGGYGPTLSGTGAFPGTPYLGLNDTTPTHALDITGGLNVTSSATVRGGLVMNTSSMSFVNGGSIENANRLLLNTAFTDGCTEGALQWNADDGTAEICMKSGTIQLQIGQELLFKAKQVGTAGLNGQVVAITGASGQRPEIELADADAANTRLQDCTIGVLTEDVSLNQPAYFNAFGYVRDVNTSAFADGDKVYLSTTAGGLTKTIPDYPAKVIPVGMVVYSHSTEGILFVRINTVPSQIVVSSVAVAGVRMPMLFDDMADPTGFTEEGLAGSSLTLSGRVFSISGSSFPIYADGRKIFESTASVTVPDTTQLNWIYYNSAGTLTQSTSFPGFDQVLVASVYYSTRMVSGLLGDERHGAYMDWRTHEYVHETIGARYASGMALSVFTSSASISAGEFYDDDHEIETPLITRFTVLYKDGSSFYDFILSTTAFYTAPGGVLKYNNGNVLTSVPVNNYAAYWIFATPLVNQPFIIVTGPRVDTLLTDARANNTLASLSLTGFPTAELKPVYRLIVRNQAGTPTYIENADYRSVSELPGSNFVPTLHSSLTGLDLVSSGHPYDSAGGFASYDASVQKAGDTMTGQLTLNGSTLTVNGTNMGVEGPSAAALNFTVAGTRRWRVGQNIALGGNSWELNYSPSAQTYMSMLIDGSAAFPMGSLTVGASTFTVVAGRVGVGITPTQSESFAVRGDADDTDIARFYSQVSTATIVLSPSLGANAARILSTYDTNSTLDFLTGGIKRMRVKGDGVIAVGPTPEVGIGRMVVQADGNGRAITLEENSGGESWQLDVNAAGDLQFENSGVTTALTIIDATNNIGIGTTTANALLSFHGSDNEYIRFQTPFSGTNADAAISGESDSGGVNLLLGSNLYYNTSGTLTRYATNRSGSGIGLGYTGVMDFYNEAGTTMPSVKMRLATTGFLGLGNTAPASKFHCSTCVVTVDGTGAGVIVQPEDTYPALISLRKNATTTSSFAAIRGENAAGAALGALGFGYDTDATDYLKYQDGFFWLTQANSNLHFGTNNAERMIIEDTGDIGIGVTNPTNKLQVAGRVMVSTMIASSSQNTTYPEYPNAQLGIVQSTTDNDPQIVLRRHGVGTAAITLLSSNLDFDTGGSRRMRIESDGDMYLGNANFISTYTGTTGDWNFGGKVGMGVSTPGGKLDVAWGGYQTTPGLKLGADIGDVSTRTNNTRKIASIGAAHYSNSEENILIGILDSEATSTKLNIGGGDANWNAVSTITFWTGANNTTTAGTARVAILADGKVGFGTTSVDSDTALQLKVSQNADTKLLVENNTAGTAARAYISAEADLGKVMNMGVASSGYTDVLSWQGRGLVTSNQDIVMSAYGATSSITFQTGGANNYMVLDKSGNLGIGDMTPDAKLDLEGVMFWGDATYGGLLSYTSADGGLIYNGSRTNHPYVFQTNATEKMRLNTSGVLLIATTTPQLATNAGIVLGDSKRLYWNSNADHYLLGNGGEMTFGYNGAAVAGIQLSASSVRQFYAYGNTAVALGYGTPGGITEVLRGVVGGNVGIGTATPTHRLSVAGDAVITSSLTVQGKIAMATYTETKSSAAISTTYDVSWSSGSVYWLSMNDNTTLTFSSAVEGQSLTLFIKQNVGSKAITWPTISWPAGVAPTLTTTAGKIDIITLVYIGGVYYGFTGGQNY